MKRIKRFEHFISEMTAENPNADLHTIGALATFNMLDDLATEIENLYELIEKSHEKRK